MSAFADVLSFVDRVKIAPDLPSVEALVRDASLQFGFDHYGLAHSARPGDVSTPVYFSNYPEEWVQRVQETGLYLNDPVLMASQRSAAAFSWHELPTILRLSPKQQQYMTEAHQLGLGNGFTVPLHIPGTASGIASFVTVSGELPRTQLPATQYLACFAFEAVRRLIVEQGLGNGDVPQLTQRQLDCLVLVARGKSDWVAGKLLNLSPETVKMHIDLAKKRFGVSSRTELVVRALYHGQVTFADLTIH